MEYTGLLLRLINFMQEMPMWSKEPTYIMTITSTYYSTPVFYIFMSVNNKNLFRQVEI